MMIVLTKILKQFECIYDISVMKYGKRLLREPAPRARGGLGDVPPSKKQALAPAGSGYGKRLPFGSLSYPEPE